VSYSTTETERSRRDAPQTSCRSQKSGRQTLTRVPHWWPGEWVLIGPLGDGNPLSGKVAQVRTLTCSITSPDQRRAVWFCHLESGGSVRADCVLRLASASEIAAAELRRGI
jgi:hypothetical protein